MPNAKVPCPNCGELTWVYYPDGARLKGVERKARILLDFDEHYVQGNCANCGRTFYAYYLER